MEEDKGRKRRRGRRGRRDGEELEEDVKGQGEEEMGQRQRG